jgi:hypothetical protein
MVVAQRVLRQHPTLPRIPSLATVERYAPALIASSVVAGLVLVLLVSPNGSGDYGQWLMTSRYYLGEAVPDYRVIPAVPPVVPMLLAAIRTAVGDPILALHLLVALLLAALGAAFYLVGTVVAGSRWVGAFSVVIGLLVTDRFMELFAFGGVLQIAAVALIMYSVAAFLMAGRNTARAHWWWVTGASSMGLAALTHAGTGVIALMVGVVVAAMVAFGRRQLGWRTLMPDLAVLVLVLAAVGMYWIQVLQPASAEYVTNPGTLAYRGPDRLFAAHLFSQWPTALLVVFGALSLAAAGGWAIAHRRMDHSVVMVAWASVVWTFLLASVVVGVATDYPRFTTPLLAPLVISAAGGLVWLIRAGASLLGRRGRHIPAGAILAVVVLAISLPAIPMALGAYARQATFYEVRDAAALERAVAWVDQALGSGDQAVLADVREGKWLEGLSGRESLFSQPVRYAFRTIEWQRSADADALLRSTTTLTSGLVTAMYTDKVTSGQADLPMNLLFAANHGGEIVDLLRIQASDTVLRRAGGGVMTADQLRPIRAAQTVTDLEASLTTVWARAGAPSDTAFAQGVTVYQNGATMRLAQSSPHARITTTLRPLPSERLTSVRIRGQQVWACFTQIGGKPPCLRMWAGPTGASWSRTVDGGLQVSSGTSGRLVVLITATTAGKRAIGLNLLDPASLVSKYDVGAVMLYRRTPAYEERLHRLEALGFSVAMSSGPYSVLLKAGR